MERPAAVYAQRRCDQVWRQDAAKIEDYSRDIDRSLLLENLKLTPAQRLEKFMKFRGFASELRRAGENTRQQSITASGRHPDLGGCTKGGIGQSRVSAMARRISASRGWMRASKATVSAQAVRTFFLICGTD